MSLSKRLYEERMASGFEFSERSVCFECVHDEDLQAELDGELEEWECSFCGRTAQEGRDRPIAVAFDVLMRVLMRGVNFLYISADDAGLVWDNEDDVWIGGQVYDSDDVAYEVCEGRVVDAIAWAVKGSIDPQNWTDSHISESPLHKALGWAWDQFKRKVMHESRFVFLSVEEESSGHPDDFTTRQFLVRVEQLVKKYDLVTNIPAGRRFWRGRLVDSSASVQDFRSAAELGSPPDRLAANSRMSPAGVSVFYGSDRLETAIAEIGAHSSRNHAIVGAFETCKDMQVIDLTKVPRLPSIFSEGSSVKHYSEVLFLWRLIEDLGKSIELDGQEHIEYVPTQVLVEYLRYVSPFRVDGLLFESSQAEGVNCVIFAGPDSCVDSRPRPVTSPFARPIVEWLRLDEDSVRNLRIVATPAGPV